MQHICKHYCINGQHIWTHPYIINEMPKCGKQHYNRNCNIHKGDTP